MIRILSLLLFSGLVGSALVGAADASALSVAGGAARALPAPEAAPEIVEVHGYHYYTRPRRAYRTHYRYGSTRHLTHPQYLRPYPVRPGYARPSRVRPSYDSYDRPQRHLEWCESQYRSYRASDDTFQPYEGPRRRCVSPFVR